MKKTRDFKCLTFALNKSLIKNELNVSNKFEMFKVQFYSTELYF